MAQRFILNEVSYFGAGARKELPEVLNRMGLKKALVCSDKGLIKVGTTAKVTEVLDGINFPYEIYSEIKPNPTVTNVKQGVEAFKNSGADCIIAIGGGSSMDTAKGIGICAGSYLAAFAAEFIILAAQGRPAHLEFFVTGFSLTGSTVKLTGAGFVLMCIFFNIINVWMEEGVFRGFFIKYISCGHDRKKALYISSLLFGLWHLVTPVRSLLDGDMSSTEFAVMSVGYVVLSMLMGIKWGLLYQMSGNIWIGMADHFFNNCVVTNLLHVVTADGVDEMQIIRVITGELISFIAVTAYSRIKVRKEVYA